VENQVVSAPVFGGVAVLSVCLSEQIVMCTAVSASADIGLEMDRIKLNNISELRGDYLHYAGMD
ncbi:hypothetical protein KA005_02680, partial [bacterium]|nr:hypothetical protein [bacterium]